MIKDKAGKYKLILQAMLWPKRWPSFNCRWLCILKHDFETIGLINDIADINSDVLRLDL